MLKAFPSIEAFTVGAARRKAAVTKRSAPLQNTISTWNADDDLQAGAPDVYTCAGKQSAWIEYGADSAPATSAMANGWSKCHAGLYQEQASTDDGYDDADDADAAKVQNKDGDGDAKTTTTLRQQQLAALALGSAQNSTAALSKPSAYRKGAGVPCADKKFWNQCPKGDDPSKCAYLQCMVSRRCIAVGRSSCRDSVCTYRQCLYWYYFLHCICMRCLPTRIKSVTKFVKKKIVLTLQSFC